MRIQKKVKVAVFATITTLIQFSENAKGGEKSNNYNGDGEVNSQVQICYVPARVTNFNKHEKNCDLGTLNGDTKTGIKLQEADNNTIGVAGANEKIAPFGSLVIVTTKKGRVYRFLCADSGSGVTNEKSNAATRLAKKQKLGREWATRPVIDLYSNYPIVSDWATVLIIKDSSLVGLKGEERRKRMQERMSIGYWESRGLVTPDQRVQLLAYNK